MNKKTKIKNLLRKRTVILDGATGTFLQASGMPQGVCPELWCIENHHVLDKVYKSYIEAGSDIVFAFTFGANPFKLAEYGETDVYGVNYKLAKNAKRAAGTKALVAGDIGPSGRFIEPFGDLSFEDAVNGFKLQIKGLVEGGVDLLVIETMMDIQEARAALLAAKETCDLFTIVTMTYETSGKTLNGTGPVTALITLQALGADAVGCNCSAGPEEMLPLIQAMKPYATVPIVAKPNAGLPKLIDNKTVFSMDAAKFASFGQEFIEAGVNLIGGCCGTGPEYIKFLKQNIAGLAPVAPFKKSISALSSAQSHLILDKSGRVKIIGERINPTGKKDLQQDLRENKTSIAKRFAKEQEAEGANILDVNAGVPGLDEVAAQRLLISTLASYTPLPLAIDSSKVEAIETALRLYPGRALINSISGESEKIKNLLPLAKKYGAMFILLPLTDAGIPERFEERIQVIKTVFGAAKGLGFSKDDIIVDALTMTVSANQNAAIETLKTVEWCSGEFGALTLLGLSNISFGLPERKWVNAGFLAMAIARGLNVAIANPSNAELMNIKLACDVLSGRDKNSKHYIESFSGQQKPDKEKTQEKDADKKIYEAIVEGDRESIASLIDEALVRGLTTAKLVSDIMIPAIRHVGDLYDKKTYFLPQLIAGAEAMQKGFNHIEPILKKDGKIKARGRIIMATVKGDIHDIGKNIVVLMLKNYGFEVIDLGKDVSSEAIIDAIKEYKPDIRGLSALMTTTMPAMKEVMTLAAGKGLKCNFMIGGAVVTRAFADSIGAHYAKDSVEAVRVAEQLVKKVF